MTADELARLLQEYRAGIEAELTLLRELATIAQDQQTVSRAGNFPAFSEAADARDRIMRSLVTIETHLRNVRQVLVDARDVAKTLAGYDEVAERHREATQLVEAILATDQQSMADLANAELARRSAVAGLDRGETTLAAYRRVLAPPIGSAKLVDKLG
ncbi:MAG: hypothetical protein IT184_17480 [Acidobacteria bacterium]|nr:hypothetical protein [Acidobacteriota bacterium]